MSPRSLIQSWGWCLTALLCMGINAYAQAPQNAEPLSSFPQDTLTIATSDAKLHRFKIWIADTESRKSQGLMFVKELPEDRGMLFVYRQSQTIMMWMKNTYVPLDMVFIRNDGRVMRVAANTNPLSLDTISSVDPVIAVLELPAGTTKRLNIRAGAVVQHAGFEKK
jgi:uncharacterized protein